MASIATDRPRRSQAGRASYRWLIPSVSLLLILAVAASPFAVDIFQGTDTEWQRRSVIGQTYGAISALLAALALGGITISVFLQSQEIRSSREFALRSIHIDLMKMAIDDAELRSCMTISNSGETVDRQHVYCNLLFSFWEARYVLGELTPEEIKGLASQMLATPPGFNFWTNARNYRFTYVESKRALRFREAFDEEYRQRSMSISDRPIPQEQK